ncbi:hypothetical protein [Streptomyces sp. FIT100]|uniref:hypothetical protein n=1 Tax=Streptomyces sp. FIT100 TaxID=2837956 RepID=UPI0028BDECD3|nr:hypothetical protein [Streptomyces sp. FIT100]
MTTTDEPTRAVAPVPDGRAPEARHEARDGRGDPAGGTPPLTMHEPDAGIEPGRVPAAEADAEAGSPAAAGPASAPASRPASEPAAGREAAPSAHGEPARAARRGGVLAGCLVAALLLAGAGLLLRAHQLGDNPATANRALTDTVATARVTGDVSSAVAKVFSYAAEDTAVTRQAARELLAGKASRQYESLFAQVERRAPEQRLTLTTRVVRAGVTSLGADRAELLLFLDQIAQRKGGPATTAAAQLSVTAELHEGRWRIVDITSR